MRRLLLASVTCVTALVVYQAHAQVSTATVVNTCGAATGWIRGQTVPVTVDTNGNLCSNASGGGGGGGGSVTQGTSPWVDNITQIGGATINLGQAAMVASVPVVIASNQTAYTVNLGTLNGAATAANQTSVIGTVAPGTAATSALLTGAIYNSAPPTLTNGQQAALQLSSAGALVVTQPPSSTINVTVNTPPNDVIAGPTASTNGSLNDVTVNSQGAGSVAVQVTGTFTGFTVAFQGSVDGTNYVSVYGAKQDTCVAATGLTTVSAGGTWIIAAAGFTKIRAHVTAVATGTATTTVNSSAGSSQQPNCSYATGANAINIAQVNGITALAGAGATGTGSLRITAAQDTTTIAGSAPGTAGSASANVLSVQGIASMTPLIMQGAAASGASVSGNPLLTGARARSSEPAAVTDGQAVALGADLTGKLITTPYANKENFIQGAASSTSNSAVTIIASAGGSLKNYITAVQCYRTDAGTTAIIVTFSDSASTIIALPNSGGGGGSNVVFPVPLATAAATAFQFTPGTSTTTVYCNAQGYKGT